MNKTHDSSFEEIYAVSTRPPRRGRRNEWIIGTAVIAGAVALVAYWEHRPEPAPVVHGAVYEGTTSSTTTPRSDTTASNAPTSSESATSSTTDPTTSATTATAAAQPEGIERIELDTPPRPGSGAVVRARTEDALPVPELLHLANASLRHGDTRRAEQRYRLVLAKDPSNAEAHTGLGDVARRENDLARAREHYLRALSTSPAYLPARIALADVEWDLGDFTSAKSHYAAAVDKLGERAPAKLRERAGMAGDAPSATIASTSAL